MKFHTNYSLVNCEFLYICEKLKMLIFVVIFIKQNKFLFSCSLIYFYKNMNLRIFTKISALFVAISRSVIKC